MCAEWLESFQVFQKWALANGYKDLPDTLGRNTLSIDRIDTEKGYSPDNCRWTTATIQSCNTKLRESKSSSYRGVYFYKNREKWVAQISVNKITLYLGIYKTELDAAPAYNTYILENCLEDYKLN